MGGTGSRRSCCCLRDVFDDITKGSNEHTDRARRAREAITEKWLDPEAWVARVSEAVVELLTTPRPQALKIAWISTWAVRCGFAEYSWLLVEPLLANHDAAELSMVVLCDQRTVASTNPDELRVCPVLASR